MKRGAEEEDSTYQQFYQSVKETEGFAAAACMARIVKAADAGIWQSAAWIMERRFNYRARQDVALTADDGATLEDVDALIERVQAASGALQAKESESDK